MYECISLEVWGPPNFSWLEAPYTLESSLLRQATSFRIGSSHLSLFTFTRGEREENVFLMKTQSSNQTETWGLSIVASPINSNAHKFIFNSTNKQKML